MWTSTLPLEIEFISYYMKVNNFRLKYRFLKQHHTEALSNKPLAQAIEIECFFVFLFKRKTTTVANHSLIIINGLNGSGCTIHSNSAVHHSLGAQKCCFLYRLYGMLQIIKDFSYGLVHVYFFRHS